MNVKIFWVSSSNNNALWYNAASDDWMIGSVDDVGASFGFISSTGDQGISSCPYNFPNDNWMYGNDGWIIADANDVSIECLTGNEFNATLWYHMPYPCNLFCPDTKSVTKSDIRLWNSFHSKPYNKS